MLRFDGWPDVRVVDAAGAVAMEQATFRLVASQALMQRAGAAAATEILRRYPERLRERGAAVYIGSGNNGGDGWVVVRALRAAGVYVRVHEAGEPKTDDARREREMNVHEMLFVETLDAEAALPPFAFGDAGREAALIACGVHVDALLGTGATGAPRGAVAGAIERIALAREAGGIVVALDVPSGVDASTGDAAENAVRADLTLTFGTVKRGLLVAREHAGEIAVLDIGLAGEGGMVGVPRLVTGPFARAVPPRIAPDAHKGTRGRLVIVGGGVGMIGAAALAARAAYRSGIGLVRLCVAPESVAMVQQLAPEAIAAAWPATQDEARALASWAQATLIGPGLGNTPQSRSLVERILRAQPSRVVLDADALNVFEGDVDALAQLLRGRAAVLTPHPLELARLSGRSIEDVMAHRFEIGRDVARRLGAIVLLKGVPTVIHGPESDRECLVSATGTPALAVGGSGDLLAGICATLLAQSDDALHATGAAAWVHGRAAELASAGRATRGITLEDILAHLADAWPRDEAFPPYPVLATLPRV